MGVENKEQIKAEKSYRYSCRNRVIAVEDSSTMNVVDNKGASVVNLRRVGERGTWQRNECL